MSYRRKHRLSTDINVTPMIDIMLVLLVVFISAMPVIYTKVDVNVPKSSSPHPADKKDSVIEICVDKNGIISCNNKVTNTDDIVKQINESDIDKLSVVIYGDTDVPYGTIIDVLSKIKNTGCNKIALITTKDQNT